MDINNLTIGQVKELSAFFNKESQEKSLQSFIGKKVIIRTYSAGVHYGTLIEKEGDEVILENARRLWFWKTTDNGISLSEVANTGLHKDSKVCSVVKNIWLQAIEIIPCENQAITNIEAASVYTA